MSTSMRIALGQFADPTHEMLTFAKQLGVAGVLFNTPTIPGEHEWAYETLVWLRQRCEQYGLRLEALENTPLHFYDRVMLGLPGRDEQIGHYQTTIRNMGRAGIAILGYHWMPQGVWRTSATASGRGGALVSAFDLALAEEGDPLLWGMRRHPLQEDRVLSAEQMWEHYGYFLRAVLPVAEEAGVRLALHADDPPIPMLGNVARIFSSFEGFERAMTQWPSPNHGIDFCVGTWSEMGTDVLGALRHFGEQGKIFYVHLRDVQGVVPHFQECFLGEGNLDIVAVMRTLQEVSFTGFIIDDHVPRLINDTEWSHRGRAHATGYLQGVLGALSARQQESIRRI
jgi:mannonate dehydratase